MEGKAGLHPGGRAGGLRAPGAGGGNPSPLLCGAGVRVGGADPWLLLGVGGGAEGLPLGGKSASPGARQREARATRVLTPPPGGLAPAPRPRPPGPASHPRARCSAGGGIGWGRGAEAAAGTTSLPAASLCARGASGGGERAGERAARARRGERASERARERARRLGCEAAPAAALPRLPATLPQRRAPCAPSRRRRLPSQAGVWSGQGSPPGTGASWCSRETRSSRGGAGAGGSCAAAPAR